MKLRYMLGFPQPPQYTSCLKEHLSCIQLCREASQCDRHHHLVFIHDKRWEKCQITNVLAKWFASMFFARRGNVLDSCDQRVCKDLTFLDSSKGPSLEGRWKGIRKRR